MLFWNCINPTTIFMSYLLPLTSFSDETNKPDDFFLESIEQAQLSFRHQTSVMAAQSSIIF
jgi:hypothetical protein